MTNYAAAMQGSEAERNAERERAITAKFEAAIAEALRLAHHYRRMWREELLNDTGSYKPRAGDEDPLAVPGEDE
jgi:hypothetical protein